MLVFGFIVALGIALSVISDGDDDGVGAIMAVVFGIVWLLVSVIGLSNSYREIAVFKSFSSYTEMYSTYDGIESTSIKAETIEKNTWLFDAQAAKETYGIFSFYPEEVLELEPIR